MVRRDSAVPLVALMEQLFLARQLVWNRVSRGFTDGVALYSHVGAPLHVVECLYTHVSWFMFVIPSQEGLLKQN